MFGKFKTKQDILLAEDEKLDIATDRKDEVRKSVIEAISKLSDKKDPTDIPKLETEEQAEKKTRRTIKNNDTKSINYKITNFTSSKTSR